MQVSDRMELSQKPRTALLLLRDTCAHEHRELLLCLTYCIHGMYSDRLPTVGFTTTPWIMWVETRKGRLVFLMISNTNLNRMSSKGTSYLVNNTILYRTIAIALNSTDPLWSMITAHLW